METKFFRLVLSVLPARHLQNIFLAAWGLEKKIFYENPLMVLDFFRGKSWTWSNMARYEDEKRQQHLFRRGKCCAIGSRNFNIIEVLRVVTDAAGYCAEEGGDVCKCIILVRYGSALSIQQVENLFERLMLGKEGCETPDFTRWRINTGKWNENEPNHT
ncbi:hypothetical protein TNCV_3149011 [Trichonephila clavipes]|nr:hypothetical protein TNCV_3149011 [Trichonephila clavipes]